MDDCKIRAGLTVARLIESDFDLDFYNVLQPSEHNLDFTWSNRTGANYEEIQGQLEIWWTVEIEARRWGIKDIYPRIKKLVLDGSYLAADEEGYMRDVPN